MSDTVVMPEGVVTEPVPVRTQVTALVVATWGYAVKTLGSAGRGLWRLFGGALKWTFYALVAAVVVATVGSILAYPLFGLVALVSAEPLLGYTVIGCLALVAAGVVTVNSNGFKVALA